MKERLSYGKGGITLDIPVVKCELNLEEVTPKFVKYGVKLSGLNEGVLFLQVLPTESGSKMRIAIGYSFSYGPVGLLLRSNLDEKKIEETLNDVVEALEESFNSEKKEG